MTRLDIRTPDGVMDTYAFTPDDDRRRWPAVIVYMDAFGIRPELSGMAQRLASNGYCVALPNLYYRHGPFTPFDREAVHVDGPERNRFKGMIQSIDAAMVMKDTAAIIDAIDAAAVTEPQASMPLAVAEGPIAVVGYCMGGGYALTAAATFPERVAAAASFHGGSLATQKADSPHRLASRMRARVYVGAAEVDATFPPEQREQLERAFTEAGVNYTLEVYEGTRHGFAVTGHLVFDQDASERHWTRLIALLRDTIG